LITELLDLTHLTKGNVQLTLESLDAHDVISSVLKNLEGEQKAKEIALELRLLAQDAHILADASKVEQVLSNLIGNAVKFTTPGGSVSVVTRNEGGTRLVVEVSDTGIGMSSEALARIFSPFEQGDASIHERFGGLGLGLSIARKLMDAHGGTLEAASQGLGQGAVFTARFPLDEALSNVITPPIPSSTTIVPTAGPGLGLRILLVEDNEDARRALSALLGSLGYEIRAAASVREALELGARESFDVLITDLGLADGSGIQLLPAIKQHSPALVGIAISGYGSAQDLVDSRAAGFAVHLVKPTRFTELRQQLELLIPEARAAALRQMRG
jgi:CheY-like chemotaxis protein